MAVHGRRDIELTVLVLNYPRCCNTGVTDFLERGKNVAAKRKFKGVTYLTYQSILAWATNAINEPKPYDWTVSSDGMSASLRFDEHYDSEPVFYACWFGLIGIANFDDMYIETDKNGAEFWHVTVKACLRPPFTQQLP